MERTGHSGVRLECGAAGKNSLVGSWYVSVRSHDGGHPAVEIPTHRDLLRSRLAVHIHKDGFDALRDFRELNVCYTKRIVSRRHKHPTLKIQNRRFFSRSCLQNDESAPRIVCRIIRGPEDSGVLAEVWHDLLFIPDVISRRKHIDSPIEKFIGDLRRHAKACSRILAIQNRQIDCEVFLQTFQAVMNDRAAGLADGVANKKNFHDFCVPWTVGRLPRMARCGPAGSSWPAEACGTTYLNLSNRWASYPRFREPRDPEG